MLIKKLRNSAPPTFAFHGITFLNYLIQEHLIGFDPHLSVNKIYLDFNVSHFGGWSDNRSSNQSWEDVFWEVRACISTLHKLEEKSKSELVKAFTISIEKRCLKNTTLHLYSILNFGWFQITQTSPPIYHISFYALQALTATRAHVYLPVGCAFGAWVPPPQRKPHESRGSAEQFMLAPDASERSWHTVVTQEVSGEWTNSLNKC